jgi:hypothetical protein
MSNGESLVSPASISARADALEKAEAAEAAKGAEAKPEEKAPETPEKKEVPEQKAPEQKVEEKKPEAKPEKKAPNDPDEMRKWNTRVAQENKKMREEVAAIRAEQEKTYKLLAKMSKTPMDYKELSKKSPEELAEIIENEKESATAEMQEKLDLLANEAKQKDTMLERFKREHDPENYPEWKRLYPTIVKIAQGPAGQGDPRVDFTRPAGEILDNLYEMALAENPTPAPVAPVVTEKVYKESEFKAMLADALAKEKDAIAKSAKEEAMRDAQAGLSEEAKGGTVASAGKGAGRIPSDQLAAFKKLSLNEQRECLIARQQQS